MHFIEKFKKDVEASLGFPIELEVFRGTSTENKTLIALTPNNVSNYDYSINTPEQYQIRALNMPLPTRENGYWNGHIASFYLQYLPGCCGICLSFHASVTPKFKRKNIGVLTRVLRQDIARAQGFTTLLSTATITNLEQNAIMKRTGAKRVYSFRNARTENEVVISTFDLRGKQTATVLVEADLHPPIAPGGTALARAA